MALSHQLLHPERTGDGKAGNAALGEREEEILEGRGRTEASALGWRAFPGLGKPG